MWLPSYNALRMEFVDAIVDGSKLFLRMDEIRAIKVPTSKYISVKALYPQFKDDPRIRDYLPTFV